MNKLVIALGVTFTQIFSVQVKVEN